MMLYSWREKKRIGKQWYTSCRALKTFKLEGEKTSRSGSAQGEVNGD